MIKMNSVSGIVCFVEDLSKTVEFYEKVGFIFKMREENYATAYLNWFWMEFVANDKAEQSVFQKELDKDNSKGKNAGTGLFVHISVEDVDEFYESLAAKGFKLSSEPKDFHWGRREFVLRDPDGYKLVFFSKKIR